VRFLPREAESRTAKFDDAVSNAVTSRDSGSTGRGRAVSRCKMAAALRSTGDSADKMASMSRDSFSRATAPTERSRNSAQIASIADNILGSPIERLFYACGHTLTPNKSSQLEARDVLPNIDRTRAAERAEKCRFCPW